MVRLQLFLSLFLLAFAMNAQPLLDKKITFSADNESLESALYRLGALPDVSLAFSNEILPKDHKVSLPKSSRTLRSTLRQLLRYTDIRHKVIGGQIVLYYKKRKLKEYILSGYIEDVDTGERLIGANIYLPEQNLGTSSNAYGFFSIRLKEGKKLINYSYLGYQKQMETINLRSNMVQTIALKPSLTLKEVIVTARDTTLPSISIFSSNLSPDDMISLPAVGGENDVIRYASFLPGVQTGADGVGGMNVRGGSADQNLILLDGVTVYNPSHLIGVFSVFNPSAIKSATLIKGRFPARYGGRLSSFLDIYTKDGNNKQWGGEIGLGLSAVKFSIEGPIIKNKSALFVSARTSPLSWLIKPVSRRIKARRNQEGFTSYLFYDMNAKWNYSFSDKDNIYVSFYRGGDNYHDEGEVSYTVNSIFFNKDITSQDLNWGNTIGAFRWNHVFGNRLFLNTSLTYSKYHFESEGGFYHTDTLITDGSIVNEALLSHFSSRIEDVGAKLHFDYKHSTNLNMHFGVDYTRHAFTPGLAANTFNQILDFGDISFFGTLFDTLNNPTIPAHEYAIYVENHWSVGPKIKLNIGLRGSGFWVQGKSYHALQPRLDVAYSLTDQMEIHASYSYVQQFLHLLTTSGVGLPTDLWVPSTQNIKPQSSAQFVLGWGLRTKNQFWINVEAYYKRLNDIIDFASDSSLGQINSYNWESKIVLGQGRAYGLEVMLEKKIGRTRGLLSYTLAKSERQFDELNNGNPFPFRFDRRHNLKTYLIHEIGKKWTFSLGFTYGTGLAVSLPTREFAYYFPSEHLFSPIYTDIFTDKNNVRLSPNHRLDFQFSYRFGQKKWAQELSLGVYNLYNRKNALYYRPGQNPDEPSEETYLKASLIPILPYVNYTIKF